MDEERRGWMQKEEDGLKERRMDEKRGLTKVDEQSAISLPPEGRQHEDEVQGGSLGGPLVLQWWSQHLISGRQSPPPLKRTTLAATRYNRLQQRNEKRHEVVQAPPTRTK